MFQFHCTLCCFSFQLCSSPVYLKFSAVCRYRLWGQDWPGVRCSSSCCSRRVRAVRLVLDQQKMWVWRNFATAGCSTSPNWRMWETSGPGPVPRWEAIVESKLPRDNSFLRLSVCVSAEGQLHLLPLYCSQHQTHKVRYTFFRFSHKCSHCLSC